MRPEYEKYQLVDDYLNNKLSSEKTMEFEKLLKEDPGFREEVYDQKLANEIIIEKRFFDVVGSLDLSPVNVGTKTALSNGLKSVIGITVTAGIGLLAFIYVGKKEEPKVEQKDVHSIVKETPNKAEAAVVENKVEESVTQDSKKPLIVDDGKTDNINLGKISPKVIPPIEKAAESEVEWSDEGTYVIEIPLDGHNNSTYKFNPENGESWSIPLNGSKNAKVKILDNTGREVHSFKVTKGFPKKWNGKLSENNTLKQGDYIYLIDFGNGKMDHGYFIITNSTN
jgi:hypothetical protein